MKRWVIAISVLLAWALLTRSKPAASPSGLGRFPTADSHRSVSLLAGEIGDWCTTLGCNEAALRQAVAAVGASEHAVRDFLDQAPA